MKPHLLKTLRCLTWVTWMALALSAAAKDNFPPKVDIISPANGAKFVAPADIKFEAQTADADG